MCDVLCSNPQIHVVRDNSGYSKGCAFVKFVDRGAAVMAISELNETIPKVSCGSSSCIFSILVDNICMLRVLLVPW